MYAMLSGWLLKTLSRCLRKCKHVILTTRAFSMVKKENKTRKGRNRFKYLLSLLVLKSDFLFKKGFSLIPSPTFENK